MSRINNGTISVVVEQTRSNGVVTKDKKAARSWSGTPSAEHPPSPGLDTTDVVLGKG
ncbi:MAG: hypothetical protein ACPHGV_06385 [Synechococcus sp.]